MPACLRTSGSVRHTATPQVATRAPESEAPVVALGAGAFLARAAAGRLGRAVVEMPWSAAERDMAPAAALAELAAARPGGPR